MSKHAENPSRHLTVRVDTPDALERALRAFAPDLVLATADGDARERRFAEASAVHQRLLALRRLAAA